MLCFGQSLSGTQKLFFAETSIPITFETANTSVKVGRHLLLLTTLFLFGCLLRGVNKTDLWHKHNAGTGNAEHIDVARLNLFPSCFTSKKQLFLTGVDDSKNHVY